MRVTGNMPHTGVAYTEVTKTCTHTGLQVILGREFRFDLLMIENFGIRTLICGSQGYLVERSRILMVIIKERE